jgi:hypothetical protein
MSDPPEAGYYKLDHGFRIIFGVASFMFIPIMPSSSRSSDSTKAS